MTGLPLITSAIRAKYGYGGQTTTWTGRSPTPLATAAARSRPVAAVVNIFQLPATIGVRDMSFSRLRDASQKCPTATLLRSVAKRLRDRLPHHLGQLPQLVHELVEPVRQER